MRLTLRRTVIAGQYRDDDFIVYDGRVAIGRILLSRAPATSPQWTWHLDQEISIARCYGHSASLEQARVAFDLAWQQVRPAASAPRLAKLRNQ